VATELIPVRFVRTSTIPPIKSQSRATLSDNQPVVTIKAFTSQWLRKRWKMLHGPLNLEVTLGLGADGVTNVSAQNALLAGNRNKIMI
jgi:molecular chaperone DnaK (HSP70)